MKKYVSCFLFFFLLTSASLITLFLMTVGEEAQRAEEVQMQESVEEPVFAKETKEEIHVVLNMEQVENQTVAEDEERYFLVAEEGDHRPLHPYAPGGIPGGGAGAADDGDLVSDNG